jgi:site-specific DNA-methyltransferase (adenine-specific)
MYQDQLIFNHPEIISGYDPHMLTSYKNKIIQGDCLKILADIEDNSVDVCFADPPFNLGKPYHTYIDRKPEAEYMGWSKQWLKELVRITKPTGWIFVHHIPRWLIQYGAILNEVSYFRHWIAWDAAGAVWGRTLLPAHYGILMYSKQPSGFKFHKIRAPHKICPKCKSFLKNYGGKPRHCFGPLVSDVWADISRVRQKHLRNNHPCPLPKQLLERIILMSSDVGDTVLDPFVGIGTTAVAAQSLGRQFVGIEIDPGYVTIARKKLRQSKNNAQRNTAESVHTMRVTDSQK